jgi:hypothetical protein
MIETEYAAPPDLMNRFVDTPVTARVVHDGVSVVVNTNDDSFGRGCTLVQRDGEDLLEWSVILDDELADALAPQTFRADAVVTIVSKAGAITLLDCESCEAFTFAPRSISASQVVTELLAVLTEECLEFHKK